MNYSTLLSYGECDSNVLYRLGIFFIETLTICILEYIVVPCSIVEVKNNV